MWILDEDGEPIRELELDPSRGYQPQPPDMNDVPRHACTMSACTTMSRDIVTKVEVAGIEPASFGIGPGLLRAQPAVGFSAPAVTQASCRRAQSLLGFPAVPATGTSGGASWRRQVPGRRRPRADGLHVLSCC